MKEFSSRFSIHSERRSKQTRKFRDTNQNIETRSNEQASVGSYREELSKPSIRLTREQRKLMSKKKDLSEGNSRLSPSGDQGFTGEPALKYDLSSQSAGSEYKFG